MSKRRWSKLYFVLKYGDWSFVWSCLAARAIKIRVRKQLSKIAKAQCIWAYQCVARPSCAMVCDGVDV